MEAEKLKRLPSKSRKHTKWVTRNPEARGRTNTSNPFHKTREEVELAVQRFLASGGRIEKIDEFPLGENLKQTILDDAAQFRNNYYDSEEEKAFWENLTKEFSDSK